MLNISQLKNPIAKLQAENNFQDASIFDSIEENGLQLCLDFCERVVMLTSNLCSEVDFSGKWKRGEFGLY